MADQLSAPATARRVEPALWALVLVSGVGPLATDTYLAALPEVRRALSTTPSVSQLTITAFIIGMAAGQLLFGPVSDGRGRRIVLIASSIAFTLMSGFCAAAPTGPTLVAVRLFEGLAGGAGVAVARAVVSDRYEGNAAAARFGTLTAMTLLGPVLAPAIGGGLLAVGDWRFVFGFLTAVGVAMVVAVLVGIPETLPPERRHAGGVRHSLSRMRELLGDRPFVRPVIVQCLATAGFFVYIGGSSFVVQEQLGFSQTDYTLLFASNAVGMATTSALFGRAVHRFGAPAVRTTGLVTSTSAATLLLVTAAVSPSAPPVPLVWVLLAVMVAGNGLCIPGSTAIAQQAGRRYGGAASALQGGLTFGTGALATPLVGFTGHQTVLVMASLMTGLYLCSASVLLVTRTGRWHEAGVPSA